MKRSKGADYIVVGGGSAGCVIASRLLENSDATVVLLEAGGRDSHPLMPLPAGFSKLLPTKHLFHFKTEPQSFLDGRSRILPQGRVLGGGSSVNAMVYVRGQAQDFDDWADAGALGWAYKDVLPYFLRSENNERFVNQYHGNDGPLGVSDIRHIDPMTRAFVRAAQSAGHQYNSDFNGKSQEGVGFCQTTTKNVRRSSTSSAFLSTHINNPRLTVLTNCSVTKILTKGGAACGVEYAQNGDSKQVFASTEVILSAGAIQTPKILMHSGIGPQETLKKLGISTIQALSGVGQNFQDHLEVPVIAFCPPNKAHGYFGQDKGLKAIKNGLQYLMFKSGPVASNVVEGHCFVNSGTGSDRADLQMQFLPLVYLDLLDKPIIHKAGATINTCVTRPYSRGYIIPRSPDPLDFPIVQPNYLADERDQTATIAGINLAREIMAASPLREFVELESMPGLERHTNEQLMHFIQEYGKTVYHPAGTCKMGQENDESTVVTPDLKVKGIDKLRVADASVMPSLTSGNTNAPSIMIGEKASDLILGRSETPQ